MLEGFFLGILVMFAVPFVLLTLYNVTHYIKSWYKSQCPACNGKGGDHSLLLLFSKDDWVTCSRCKGTGRFYK